MFKYRLVVPPKKAALMILKAWRKCFIPGFMEHILCITLQLFNLFKKFDLLTLVNALDIMN